MSVKFQCEMARGRKTVFADVQASIEALGNVQVAAEGSAAPINREKTIRNKINVMRGLAKKFLVLRKQNADPSKDEVESLDWRDIFQLGVPGLKTFLEEAYPNRQTRNSTTGYLKRVIDQLGYGRLGWNIGQYTSFDNYMTDQAQQVKAQRQQNPIPQRLAANPTITWQRLLDVEKEWREDETKFGTIPHLNLALRVLLAPKRDDTFARLKFVSRVPAVNAANDEWNYVILTANENTDVKLDFRRFKTSDSYPRMLLNLTTGKDENALAGEDNDYNDICPDLKELAKILRKSYERKHRTFVMSNPPATRDEFSVARAGSMLQDCTEKAVGVRLGIRELRRLASTYAFGRNWSGLQRQKQARLQEHSLGQAVEYEMQGRPERAALGEDDLPLGVAARLAEVDRLKDELTKIKRAVKTAVDALRAI